MVSRPKAPDAPGKSDKPASGETLEPKTITLEDRLPAHVVIPYAAVAKTSFRHVEQAKLDALRKLLWLPESMSADEQEAQLVRATDLLASIKPGDGIEMMLAEQMVGTHVAAAECLRRAMLESQTFDGRYAALNQAQKLMELYAKQLAALDKHRGRGEQRVTVKHVHVAPGGQAIVGNLETGTAPPMPERPGEKGDVPTGVAQPAALAALDHGVPLPVFNMSGTKVRRP